MSAEVVTSITRPNIFPECRNCPIASAIIDSWLTYIPILPHRSVETTKIKITCSKNDGRVLLLEETELKIQFVKGRPVLEIQGGNFLPEPVECPHFNPRRQKSHKK